MKMFLIKMIQTKTFLAAVILFLGLILAVLILRLYNSFGKEISYDEFIVEDAKQKPLQSKFGHKTTAKEVVRGMDLTGKNIVITGGYTGIGLETTKALSAAGATVIVLARDVERAKKNLKNVSNVEIEYIDLLKPDSIDDFARKFIASERPLHVLINNAGIINTPLTRDERGYEIQFATNMLGHFELTAKLFPALKQADGARVVNLSSRGHRTGGVQFDDINFEKSDYTGMKAYAQSKTALVLFTRRLDELGEKHKVRSFAVHPGPIPSSDIFAESMVGIESAQKVARKRMLAKFLRGFNITWLQNFVRNPKNEGDVYKTVQEGASTSVWAAIGSDLNERGGVYCEDCNIAVVIPNDNMAPFGVRPWALDGEDAERLWKLCEEMTGVQFIID